MAAGAGTVTVRIIGDSSHFERALGKVNSGLDKLGNAGGKMRQVGAGMTRNLTLPLAGLAAVALKVGADYETSMNVLQSVTKASGRDMKKFGDLAIALGNDLKLPSTSAADAGEAMTELAKAGLSVKDVMSATRGVLQLSAAAGLGNAEAAEIAANALNAFGLAGSKATDVANELAAIANASSVDVREVADAFKMAAAVFSSLQGPAVGAENAMKELNIAIGILGNNGIKGSDAGTSLKQTLLQLASPSKKATNEMQNLMHRIGETGSLAYDASGKMRPLRKIIELVTRSTYGLSQAERDNALSTIFGSDAIRSILALLKDGTAGWDKMAKAVNDGSAASDMAAAKNKGLKGALDALQSTGETFLLKVVMPMMDDFRSLTLQLAKAVDWFSKLDPKIQKAVFAGLAFLAVLGPIISAVSKVITVVRALGLTMSFLAANPLVLVVAAVAAIGVALYELYQHCDTFRTNVNAAFQFLVDKFLAGVEWIVKGAAKAFGWVPGLGDDLRQAAKDVEKFRDDWNAAMDGIKPPPFYIAAPGQPSLAAPPPFYIAAPGPTPQAPPPPFYVANPGQPSQPAPDSGRFRPSVVINANTNADPTEIGQKVLWHLGRVS